MNESETLAAARAYYANTLKWLGELREPDGALPEALLTTRPCPLCGATGGTPFVEKLGFRYIRCERCELIYVPRCLRDVHEGTLCDDYVSLMRQGDRDARHFRRVLRLLERQAGRRLLDVGCGNGLFMEFARQHGWQTSGVEVNPKLAERARQLGHTVQTQAVEQLSAEQGPYDAVTLLQVVEHLDAPLTGLRKLHSLMPAGGILLLDTPNAASHLVRLLGPEHHRHFCGWMHVNIFTPRTLRELARRAGFRPLCTRTYGEELGLRTLRAMARYPCVYDPVSPQYLQSAEAGAIPWERPAAARPPSAGRRVARALVAAADAALAAPADALGGGSYMLLAAVRE